MMPLLMKARKQDKIENEGGLWRKEGRTREDSQKKERTGKESRRERSAGRTGREQLVAKWEQRPDCFWIF